MAGQTPPNRLSEHRRAAGLTQEQLARRSDLSVFTINRLEAGRDPNLSTAQRVAQALAVGVADVWPELEAAS